MKANPFARSATIATLTVYALAEGRQCVGEVTGTGRFTSHGAYPRGVDPEQPEQPEQQQISQSPARMQPISE